MVIWFTQLNNTKNETEAILLIMIVGNRGFI
jgi:hypothetical protein